MRIDPRRFSVSTIIVAGLIGCGGGGGSEAPTNQPPPAPPLAAVQDGAFKDSNVEGLRFESGAQSGSTDAAGRYQCETGSDVTFSIGAVMLGSTACSTLASPPALIGDGTLDDPATLNMAAFLQMLDTDEDPNNGITISTGLQSVADSWPAIDFTATDFSSELIVPLADIMSVEQRMPFDLSTVPTIVSNHLRRTLSCAYSGTFVGQLSGSSTAGVWVRVGFENFFSRTDDVEWLAYDPNEGTRSTIVGYEVRVPPSFDTTADPVIQITGTFETPDQISGTWNFPEDNANGNYVVNRLGGNTAESRLNGSYVTDDGGFGVLVFDITGSELTGEAFEATDGTIFAITGTLDGDDVTIQATGGGETINGSGRVTRRDAFGLPRDIVGELDVGGTFFSRGCKLN
ncbi:MAG: hypothetical protein AAGC71_04850 [Pseudomonadota bacterium]